MGGRGAAVLRALSVLLLYVGSGLNSDRHAIIRKRLSREDGPRHSTTPARLGSVGYSGRQGQEQEQQERQGEGQEQQVVALTYTEWRKLLERVASSVFAKMDSTNEWMHSCSPWGRDASAADTHMQRLQLGH